MRFETGGIYTIVLGEENAGEVSTEVVRLVDSITCLNCMMPAVQCKCNVSYSHGLSARTD